MPELLGDFVVDREDHLARLSGVGRTQELEGPWKCPSLRLSICAAELEWPGANGAISSVLSSKAADIDRSPKLAFAALDRGEIGARGKATSGPRGVVLKRPEFIRRHPQLRLPPRLCEALAARPRRRLALRGTIGSQEVAGHGRLF